MLTSLHIKNFRGLRDLKIEPLKQVNLITGQNNTGKTGVLEALVLLLDDQTQTYRNNLPNLFRTVGGDWNENFWKWLFYNKNLKQNLKVEATLGKDGDFAIILRGSQAPIDFNPSQFGAAGQIGGVPYMLTMGKAHAGLKPAVFSTHPSDPIKDAIDYNRVILKRRKKQVEKLLKEIEPRLEAVEALQTGQPGHSSTPLIYADLGLSEMIPVTQLGQGFNRLLDIYSEIVVADAKVLLIDEIENGLHHSVMPVIWKGLFSAAKEFDVQIFATTHSWECILAADEAARAGENYDLALIRLDRVKDDIKATVIDEKSLSTAKELQWEMR
jgi:predicted ATP-dependent endonuclease of OLD family